MPSATHAEDDDPVIASYDVFISPSRSTVQENNTASNIYVLQYPAHRPSYKPYNDARSQKPTALRIKPTTGVFELDVPLRTNENYNEVKGAQFGHALAETRLSHTAAGYGLSGGFSANNQSNQQNVSANVQDIPQYGDNEPQLLKTQTLGGKSSTSSDRDPVYMLGSMRGDSIHLTHLDGVIQMRPQLHHFDARDELASRKAAGTKTKPQTQPFENPSNLPVKLESKAIEMKIKDTKEDAKDRNLNANAKLLREIQTDPWKTHSWHETPPPPPSSQPETETASLKSTIDNDEWLDRMSSPGIELRTRLKGRDRERARRKRQERLRLSKADAPAAPVGPFVEDGDGTATESSSDGEDDAVKTEEPDVVEVEPAVKRRGRPRKEVVEVD